MVYRELAHLQRGRLEGLRGVNWHRELWLGSGAPLNFGGTLISLPPRIQI